MVAAPSDVMRAAAVAVQRVVRGWIARSWSAHRLSGTGQSPRTLRAAGRVQSGGVPLGARSPDPPSPVL
eukprot:6982183-Alexandrium_andersonii.AAC.1